MFQIRKISFDYAGRQLIIHYYNLYFNDQKVAVGGCILAICHGKCSTSFLVMNNDNDNQIRSHCFTMHALNHNLHQFTKNT